MGGPRHRGGGISGITVLELILRIVAVCGLVAATACAGNSRVPVTDHSAGVPRATHRIVQPGDTLYSIAWDVGLDYKTLAQWNRIGAPYLIKPGQRLRIAAPKKQTVERRRSRTPPASKTRNAERARTAASRPPASVRGWIWPSRGKVVARFSPRAGRKGIDIAGAHGETIRAAAGGRVVYAGTGLRGYGMLIIVKHNETFLSAYAHNRKILVSEGSQVQRGETIAEMGSTGTNRVKLHFEIRRRGVPVDPLRYLPKR